MKNKEVRPLISKAYDYAKKAVRLKTTPKYVKKQLREFIKIFEGKSKKYIISEKKLRQIEGVLKLLIMPIKVVLKSN